MHISYWLTFAKRLCSSHNTIFLTLDQNEKSDQGHWTCATLIWETIMSTINHGQWTCDDGFFKNIPNNWPFRQMGGMNCGVFLLELLAYIVSLLVLIIACFVPSPHALFNDPTTDSIANNFVIGVYCRCLQILYQIVFFYATLLNAIRLKISRHLQ